MMQKKSNEEEEKQSPNKKPLELNDSDNKNQKSIAKKIDCKPGIQINTSRSRGELPLLKYLIEKNSWKEVFGDKGDILWSGLVVPDESYYMATEIFLNRIPGMSDLAQKKGTGYFLNKFREYFPDEYDFYPKTFLYPEEEINFAKYFKEKNGNLCFIAKPTSGGQGDGIKIINNLSASKFSTAQEMVIQEYIDNPLIIDKKKFDLRLFVLIESVQPFRAFLCDEGLARFATEDYQPISKENLRNFYMHLTNYSLNKMSPKFVYSEEITEIHQGSKRTLASLWKSLAKEGISKNTVMDSIEKLIVKFLTSLKPFLLFAYKTAFSGKNIGKCFHVIGIDILIDSNLKPWLLEINNYPSLDIRHEEEHFEKGVTNNKKNSIIISPIDKYVKEKVVEDSILLVLMNPKEKENLNVGSIFNSMKFIYNSEEEEESDENIFEDMLEIFGKLSGFKFRGSLTSNQFAKLANLTGMTNENFNKTSYNLLFTKVLYGEFDTKSMNFQKFLQAFEVLASKLIENYSDEDKLSAVYDLKERVKREISCL